MRCGNTSASPRGAEDARRRRGEVDGRRVHGLVRVGDRGRWSARLPFNARLREKLEAGDSEVGRGDQRPYRVERGGARSKRAGTFRRDGDYGVADRGAGRGWGDLASDIVRGLCSGKGFLFADRGRTCCGGSRTRCGCTSALGGVGPLSCPSQAFAPTPEDPFAKDGVPSSRRRCA